ncbi:MAG TPA: insulinase family protein [Desulfobacteraceae bacterium]|nr:insulinase family protein [Desulfobacteraceae bacterium]
MHNRTVLKNGVRIVSEQIEHLHSVSVGIWVNVGSRDEDIAENGVSHFIEHMFFKGTDKRSSFQIAKELDIIGGMSNAFTAKENTCYYARVLGKHFPVLTEILSDIFLNSIFDPGDIEREKQVVLQEINMVEDTPEDNIHILFNSLFWNSHPIGMSILGTDKTVSGLQRESMLEYISKFYVPERILIAAAGDLDHNLLVSSFEPYFESFLPGEDSTIKRKVPLCNSDILINPKDLEQVHISIGSEAPSQISEKRFACAVLNTILGGNMSSRLFQEVREKRGLAYSIYSFVSSYIDTGFLCVYVATEPSNVNPVLDTIQDEIKKITRGQFPRADMEAAKDYLTGSIYLSSENTESRMMRLAKNELIFKRYIGYDELVSNLEAVTFDDVVETAKEIFQNGKTSLAALGPIRDEDIGKGRLDLDL